MAQLRWINTRIWSADEYFAELKGNEKLFFLYLLTNNMVTMIGVYELPLKTAASETDLTKAEIKAILEKFSNDHKFYYLAPYIVIENFRHHQNNDGDKTQKGIVNAFNTIPCKVVKEMIEKGYAEYLISLVREYSKTYNMPCPCLSPYTAENILEIRKKVDAFRKSPGEESVTIQKDIKSLTEHDIIDPVSDLLEYWIKDLKLNVMRKVTAKARQNYISLLRDWTDEEIRQMMAWYSEVCHDPQKVGHNYSWAKKWTFELFLKRGYQQFADNSCLTKFISKKPISGVLHETGKKFGNF